MDSRVKGPVLEPGGVRLKEQEEGTNRLPRLLALQRVGTAGYYPAQHRASVSKLTSLTQVSSSQHWISQVE